MTRPEPIEGLGVLMCGARQLGEGRCAARVEGMILKVDFRPTATIDGRGLEGQAVRMNFDDGRSLVGFIKSTSCDPMSGRVTTTLHWNEIK